MPTHATNAKPEWSRRRALAGPGSRIRCACLCLGVLVAGTSLRAQAAADAPPAPTLEIGLGATSTPGWLGDNHQVVHGTAWVNAEYTTQYYGRLQASTGSLTMDPSVNWDPWVKGVASFGYILGYHGNSSIGEGPSPRISGSTAGLDGGIQIVAPIFGAPLFAQIRKAFSGEQGWIGVLGSYLPVHPAQNVTLAFVPTARWLDKRQSQLCFSAPAPEGGQAPYSATSGFQDVALEVAVDWQFAGRFHWVSSASQRWLTGSARRTPLTLADTQRGYSSGVSIHF